MTERSKHDDLEPRGDDLDLEVNRILQDLARDGTLFRIGWKGLLCHLLSDYCHGGVTAFNASAAELRQAAARAIGEEEELLPDNVEELINTICKQNLRIRTLPRDLYIEEQQRAAEDLRAIRGNIERCESELRQIETRSSKGAVLDSDRQRTAYLRYKIGQNCEARADIVLFLEEGIQKEVFHKLHRGMYEGFLPATLFMFHAPYDFRLRPHLYSPENLSQIRNKFRDRSMREVRNWERLFREDREEFHRKLRDYISEAKIVPRLRETLMTHHRLAARADVLSGALDAYSSGRFTLFCNIAPIQVEGLIGDYCEEIGIPISEIQFEALPSKLKKIQAREEVFGDFEYFRFHFSVLRNKVAHGRFEDQGSESIADLLLLDLADLCRRLLDAELPINKLVTLLRDVDTLNPDPEKLLQILKLHTVELPEFYRLTAHRQDLFMACKDATFWDHLERQVNTRGGTNLEELRAEIIRLKRLGLNNVRAGALLSMISQQSARPDAMEDIAGE